MLKNAILSNGCIPVVDQPQDDVQKFKRLKRIEGRHHVRALNWSCYQSRPYLASERACKWLIECIESSRSKHGFSLFAWCIMPTHVHLLIDPGPAEHAAPVSAILKSIKQPVAQRAVAWVKANAPGFLDSMLDVQPDGASCYRFWQRGGGYDRNLFERDSIAEMIRYIHNNPVEAGLCARPEEWPWSSAATFRDTSEGMITLDRLRY